MVNEPVNASSPAGDIAARRDAIPALSMTLVVADMLDTFPEARWVAIVAGASSSENSELSP
jgi:hypothetical protein